MSRSISLAVAATALAAGAPFAAQAQDYPSEERSITIVAPAFETEVNDPQVLGKTRQLTASSVVYVGDLNLDTQAGREELQQRVEVAAEETCEWLNELYPADHPIGTERGCVDRAIDRANEQVLATIAAY